MKFIIACSCGQTVQYAMDAYTYMAHTRTLPDIYRTNKGYVLLNKLPRGTNIYDYISKLLSTNSKYAYYFEYDDKGDVVKQWDLLEGRKVID